MKANNKVFIATLVLCAFSLAAMLCLFPLLPSIVPINWNFAGQIVAWGSKWASLATGAMPLLICLALRFLPSIDPRRRNYRHFSKAYSIFSALIPLVLLLFTWVFFFAGLGIHLPVTKLIFIFMGILFLVMGNYMPQLRSSYFIGFRTPWALDNEYVWRKTHRFGGAVFVLAGTAFILSSFLPTWFGIVPLVIILAGSILTYIYSFIIYRRHAAQHSKEDNHADN